MLQFRNLHLPVEIGASCQYPGDWLSCVLLMLKLNVLSDREMYPNSSSPTISTPSQHSLGTKKEIMHYVIAHAIFPPHNDLQHALDIWLEQCMPNPNNDKLHRYRQIPIFPNDLTTWSVHLLPFPSSLLKDTSTQHSVSRSNHIDDDTTRTAFSPSHSYSSMWKYMSCYDAKNTFQEFQNDIAKFQNRSTEVTSRTSEILTSLHEMVLNESQSTKKTDTMNKFKDSRFLKSTSKEINCYPFIDDMDDFVMANDKAYAASIAFYVALKYIQLCNQCSRMNYMHTFSIDPSEYPFKRVLQIFLYGAIKESLYFQKLYNADGRDVPIVPCSRRMFANFLDLVNTHCSQLISHSGRLPPLLIVNYMSRSRSYLHGSLSDSDVKESFSRRINVIKSLLVVPNSIETILVIMLQHKAIIETSSISARDGNVELGSHKASNNDFNSSHKIFEEYMLAIMSYVINACIVKVSKHEYLNKIHKKIEDVSKDEELLIFQSQESYDTCMSQVYELWHVLYTLHPYAQKFELNFINFLLDAYNLTRPKHITSFELLLEEPILLFRLPLDIYRIPCLLRIILFISTSLHVPSKDRFRLSKNRKKLQHQLLLVTLSNSEHLKTLPRPPSSSSQPISVDLTGGAPGMKVVSDSSTITDIENLHEYDFFNTQDLIIARILCSMYSEMFTQHLELNAMALESSIKFTLSSIFINLQEIRNYISVHIAMIVQYNTNIISSLLNYGIHHACEFDMLCVDPNLHKMIVKEIRHLTQRIIETGVTATDKDKGGSASTISNSGAGAGTSHGDSSTTTLSAAATSTILLDISSILPTIEIFTTFLRHVFYALRCEKTYISSVSLDTSITCNKDSNTKSHTKISSSRASPLINQSDGVTWSNISGCNTDNYDDEYFNDMHYIKQNLPFIFSLSIKLHIFWKQPKIHISLQHVVCKLLLPLLAHFYPTLCTEIVHLLKSDIISEISNVAGVSQYHSNQYVNIIHIQEYVNESIIPVLNNYFMLPQSSKIFNYSLSFHSKLLQTKTRNIDAHITDVRKDSISELLRDMKAHIVKSDKEITPCEGRSMNCVEEAISHHSKEDAEEGQQNEEDGEEEEEEILVVRKKRKKMR